MHWGGQIDLSTVTNSHSQFIRILDVIPDDYASAEKQEPWRSKGSVFGNVFKWLFRGLDCTDDNIQWLKDNVDILMSNQHLQQKQIKEIFK